jgi:tetratricopeptide (TPR) repeat protein
METDPVMLEKQANSLYLEKKYIEAFESFERAAANYKRGGNHKQAALCFASAASCWSIQCGEKRFYNAAIAYEQAARQAQVSGDLEYASLLYKYAAINYERDGEFIKLSECAYCSRECLRKFLTYRLFNPNRIHPIVKTKEGRGLGAILKRLFLWFLLSFSFLIWGHGEKPSRVFYCGVVIVLLSAILYSLTYLVKETAVFRPNFFEAFYFSVITFTTVGYGDLTPIGFSRLIASLESFCGIFIIPIFIISLARKYLRI